MELALEEFRLNAKIVLRTGWVLSVSNRHVRCNLHIFPLIHTPSHDGDMFYCSRNIRIVIGAIVQDSLLKLSTFRQFDVCEEPIKVMAVALQ